MKASLSVGLVCLLALSAFAQADEIALWSFGASKSSYTLLPQVDVTGGATLTPVGTYLDSSGGNGLAFTDLNSTDWVAGQCLHWTKVKGTQPYAGLTLALNATGWQNLDIRWDYKSKYDTTGSSGGPVQWDINYSTDGTTWLPISTAQQITCDSAWHSLDIDLSSFTALNNCSTVQIQMINPAYGALSGGDYWEDNIQISGSSAPEPATLGLLALGGLAIARRRSIRR